MVKKEIKYGYLVGDKISQIVKPSNLTKKIKLTPKNSKFVFNGTRHDILKWMSSHSELLIEYDPSDQSPTFSPSSSPPSSPIFPEVSEILTTSPTSLTYNSTIPHDIVFDLFTIPDDSNFNRPLNIALKCIPWVEVTLEIRPADENIDSKLYPIHRVILPSGSSLFEISKVLEKRWKSLIPDSTAFAPDCFIRNSELLYPQNKFKYSNNNENNNDDDDEHSEEENEENSYKYNKFMDGIAKRVPTVDLWLRQKQTTGIIPPGVLTPYVIDDVLEGLNDNEKEEHENEIVNEKIPLNKQNEAELDKELTTPDLPRYETVFDDKLLERGKSIKREKYSF